MSRLLRPAAALIMIAVVLTGCGRTDIKETSGTKESKKAPVSESYTEADIDDITEVTDTEPVETKPVSTFKYDVYKTSPMFDEVMGEDMASAYQNMLTAVMNGETEFECSDSNTYDWMIGQYPYNFCPVLKEHAVSMGYYDGKGHIELDCSYEQFREELQEFGVLVEDMMNEVFEDDYTDFEKALALYMYFSEYGNFTYDYDAANSDVYLDTNSILKVMTTRYGICGDLSTTYSFLLAQADVDAGTIGGVRSSDGAPHGWSLIRLDGQCYQIDPTYALGMDGYMAYFMMDTDKRELEDGYMREDFTYVNHYTIYAPVAYDVTEFYCDDNRYEDLWDMTVLSFDPDTKTMCCYDYYGNTVEVDYSGLE